MFDTWTQWSAFGQIVILCLIEVGGLGFMSAMSVFVFMLRRKVGLKQRLVMAQAMSVNDVHGIMRLQKLVLFGSLSLQGAGALILTLRFWPELGLAKGLQWGIFHSVSAFCNAGFDIMGCFDPGMSVMRYRTDPVVNLTLMTLIVVGGLGFFVWDEVLERRTFKKFSVYSKLVLTITGILIVGGTVLIAAIEWNNPDTLGGQPWYDKLQMAAFQSVSLRTAGFAGLDQGKLTDAGKAVSIALMLIGGSSGSTAGGVKTVTVVVMLMYFGSPCPGTGECHGVQAYYPQLSGAGCHDHYHDHGDADLLRRSIFPSHPGFSGGCPVRDGIGAGHSGVERRRLRQPRVSVPNSLSFCLCISAEWACSPFPLDS